MACLRFVAEPISQGSRDEYRQPQLAGERLDQVCVWPESKCGRLFERDRLDGRADPIVTDLGRRDAALMCDDLGGGEAAKAALAGAHAAAREGFALARPQAAQGKRSAQFAGRDFLAAAGNHVVGRHAMLEPLISVVAMP